MGRLRQAGGGRRLFRGRRTSSRNQSVRRSSTSSPQIQRSNQVSKPATQSSSPKDQGVKPGTAQSVKGSEESAAKQKAESLFGNMFGGEGVSKLFSGEGIKTLQGATQKFEFDKKERERAEEGLAALKKMAGKDGVLTPEDRQNIIGQMDAALEAEKNKTVNSIAGAKIQEAKNNRGPLRKALFPNAPLVSKIGNKKRIEALNDPRHMQTARNQALGELNQGFQQMGMETKEPVSFQQGLQNARSMPSISVEDTAAFKDTMTMVRDKAKGMGLPQGKFEKGLPVAFLEDVLAGKRAMSLLQHQTNPFGN